MIATGQYFKPFSLKARGMLFASCSIKLGGGLLPHTCAAHLLCKKLLLSMRLQENTAQ